MLCFTSHNMDNGYILRNKRRLGVDQSVSKNTQRRKLTTQNLVPCQIEGYFLEDFVAK